MKLLWLDWNGVGVGVFSLPNQQSHLLFVWRQPLLICATSFDGKGQEAGNVRKMPLTARATKSKICQMLYCIRRK